MERGRLSFQHIIHNPLNVQGDDCPATFVGLKEEAVVGVVVEEILGEGSRTEDVLQDEEVAFPVGISVGIVFPELVAGGSIHTLGSGEEERHFPTQCRLKIVWRMVSGSSRSVPRISLMEERARRISSATKSVGTWEEREVRTADRAWAARRRAS